MLTDAALRERKWGPFPSLRLVLENKPIPTSYYGISSVSGNMFDEMNRLVEITGMVREYENDIKETAKSAGPEKMYRDLDLLQSKLDAVSSFFKQQAEDLREISSKF